VRIRAYWLLVIFCLLVYFSADAQVKYAFSKDTVSINGGQTFANLLKIVNPYSKRIVLKQDNTAERLKKGMLTLPDSIVLNAEETRTFPLKYIADRQTINRNIQDFGLRLVTADPAVQVQQAAVFYTQLTDVGGLVIGTEESEVYLSQLTNQAQVIVRCANNGFIPITFKLLLNGIPDGLEFTGQTMTLTLQPGAQQLLPFLARNKAGSRNSGDYTVTIQAVDDSNHPLASKIIRILNITSARRMGYGNSLSGPQNNSLSLNYVSQNKNSSYLQLQGNGKLELGEQQTLMYRLQADRFAQPGFNGFNIYNSYLDYQSKSWGIKAGNIYENLDYSLGGRGIKANLNLKNKAVISVYGVESDFMLYTQQSNTIPSAKIAAIDYQQGSTGLDERRISFLHSHDNFTHADVNQVSAKASFKPSDSQVIGFEGGLSTEKIFDQSEPAKQGFAGGMTYKFDNKFYHLNAAGYYSNPYYTGLRRGNLYSNMSVQRKVGSSSAISFHFSLQQNNAKYQRSFIDSLYRQTFNKTGLENIGIGYNTKIGLFNLGFGSYWMRQSLDGYSIADVPPVQIDWKSSSAHFTLDLGYNSRIQSFTMNADYGYTYMNSSDLPPAPFHSLRINSNYNLAFFGLNSYIQINPYYLSDVISVNGNQRYSIYSFAPNVHFTTLKNSLSFQLGGTYNYYGFTKSDSYGVSGSTKYLLKGNWSLTADVQFNVTKQQVILSPFDQQLNTAKDLDNIYINNRQVRLGVEKHFGSKNNGSKKLTLAYYEDRNNNGQREADEPFLPGVLVKINGEAALTNSNGKVEFKNMKKESYTAAIENTKGWSLQEPTTLFLDKSKDIEVPLVKTQALNGKIKLLASKYLNGQPELVGIKISAIDANGRIHQTLTDEKGAFCFFLPRNNYTVYVETEGMPFSIENGKEKVLLAGAPVEMITFLYKDERRKVGVMHF